MAIAVVFLTSVPEIVSNKRSFVVVLAERILVCCWVVLSVVTWTVFAISKAVIKIKIKITRGLSQGEVRSRQLTRACLAPSFVTDCYRLLQQQLG